VSDPRYVLLPSVSARREAFDEYCRDRARELRQSNVKKEKDLANPKEAFERLLKEEVKSTRTSWTDFRRTWKKDRRFWGWGRDDREREKRFRDYLKELGESKSLRRIANIYLIEGQKSEQRFRKLRLTFSRC
jgi:transcription elongation regulator 1